MMHYERHVTYELFAKNASLEFNHEETSDKPELMFHVC